MENVKIRGVRGDNIKSTRFKIFILTYKVSNVYNSRKKLTFILKAIISLRINQTLMPIKLTKKNNYYQNCLLIEFSFCYGCLFTIWTIIKLFIILADIAILEYDLSQSFFIYKVNCSNDIKAEVITHLKLIDN